MADISPETAAKIHDLEARYEENRGRYFVALASALREAGEVGRAEELLRSGLRHYPGSLSAHIVLGRCLADRGATEEATLEFRHVLSVDPQNLIALRTLGEMSASSGRADEAARWYRELLAVDPMNKEAKDALDALASAAQDAAPGASFGAPDRDEFAQPDYGLVELSPDPAPAPAAAEFGMVEPAELDFEITPSRADEDPFSIVAEPAATRDADAAGQAPTEFGLVELDAPVAPSGDALPAEPAAHEPSDFGAWGEISLERPADPPATVADEGVLRPGEYNAFSFGDLPPGAIDAAPTAEAGARSVDDRTEQDEVEVVTETMAELYARQGFHDRAADVYRELMRLRGEEPGLVARLAEAERRARGEEEPVAGTADTWQAVTDEPESAVAADEAGLGALPMLETGLPGLGLPVDPDFPSFEPEPPVQLGEPVSLGEPLEVASYTEPGAAALRNGADDAEWQTAASAPTGDAFADSFAHGFAGAPAAGEVRSEFTAPATVWIEATPASDPQPDASATEPAPELVSGLAEQPYGLDTIGGSHADDPLPIAGTVAPPSAAAPEMPPGDFGFEAGDLPPVDSPAEQATTMANATAADEPTAAASGSVEAAVAGVPVPTTISAYLASLLAWRPGMPTGAPIDVAPDVDAAPPADVAASTSFDADGSGVTEVSSGDIADVALPAPADEAAADELMAGEEDLPWINTGAAEPAAPVAEQSSPWETPWEAPAEVAEPLGIDAFAMDTDDVSPLDDAVAPAGDEAMYPWEFAANPAPAPADEQPAPAPTGEAPAAGGFSFEDFFAAPPEPAAPPAPAAPAPAPLPEPLPMPEPTSPAPPAPAAPGTPAGGAAVDDEEDLESFQAWLQSLKR